MARMRFVNESQVRSAAAAAYETLRGNVLRLIPDAVVEHVGGTSVPGAVTKGDVDLAVLVTGDRFEAAVSALRSIYAIHQPENWTTTYASFREDPVGELAVGIQLCVRGSDDDFLVATRDLLRGDRRLLHDYNELKKSHAGAEEDEYLAAKARFMDEVVRRVRRKGS